MCISLCHTVTEPSCPPEGPVQLWSVSGWLCQEPSDKVLCWCHSENSLNLERVQEFIQLGVNVVALQ